MRLRFAVFVLLAALGYLSLTATPAYAEIVCEKENAGSFCVTTCTDTVTSEQTASSVPWACETDFTPGTTPTGPLPTGPITSGSSGGSGSSGSGQDHCSRSGNLTSCTEKCIDAAGYVTKYIKLEGRCTTGNEVPDAEDVDCVDDQIAPDRCIRKCYDKATGALRATLPINGTCADPTTGGGGGSSGGGSTTSGGGSGGACTPDPAVCGCDGTGVTCCMGCTTQIPEHHNRIRTFITQEFDEHENWMIVTYFQQNILSEMMMMATQLSATMEYQMEIFGSFLDAKHQLESQRIFQQLSGKAIKDYTPSEGMCTFGTTTRSLASSERRTNVAATVIANRMMQRQTLNGEVVSHTGKDSDERSRLSNFISTYCDPADNQKLLVNLCKGSTPARRNIDIDYTRNIESRLTLDMEYADIGANTGGGAALTTDEQDIYALSANLFAHNIVEPIMATQLGEGPKFKVRMSTTERYMDLRSVYAKRSVAQNTFASLVSMRAAGDPAAAPYMKAVMKGLGVSDDAEIEKLIGKNPSYFAQMEVLTKRLYQKPIFYTELYDKPVNVKRKGAALQAISLMQDRDIFNSLLRNEAVLSVLLETELVREQEKVASQKGQTNPAGRAR